MTIWNKTFAILLTFVFIAIATLAVANEPLYPQQLIDYFEPASGPVGTIITVVGSGFSGSHAAWVGDTRAKLVVESDTKAFITVPPTTKSGLQFLGIYNAAHAAFAETPFNVIPKKIANGTTISGPLEIHDLIFQAIPSTIYVGSNSTLVWSIQNMTGCVGSGGWTGTPTGSGTLVVSPSTTTSYTLTCQSATGPIHVTATVTANPLPPAATVILAANPTTITQGSNTVLTWSSANATNCTKSVGWSGSAATNGSLIVSPTATTAYTLTCTGPGGSGQSSTSVTVNPIPIPSVILSVNPTSITGGNSSTLTWSSTNATTCTKSVGWSGSAATNGTLIVSPTTTTTYTLTCTGAGGTTSASATLTVTTLPAPTATISANPTSITSGNSSTLTWSSTNATTCTKSVGWSGSAATNGTLIVSPTTTTTYTLTCTGAGGSTSISTAVIVNSNVVNGTCGSANGTTVNSAPSSNLCTTGSASSVIGTGPWNWTCVGNNGGTTASCSASLSGGPQITSMYFLNPVGAYNGSYNELVINGSGFSSGAVASYGSTAMTTTYVNPTQVTAQFPVGVLTTSSSSVVISVSSGGNISAGSPLTNSTGVQFTSNNSSDFAWWNIGTGASSLQYAPGTPDKYVAGIDDWGTYPGLLTQNITNASNWSVIVSGNPFQSGTIYAYPYAARGWVNDTGIMQNLSTASSWTAQAPSWTTDAGMGLQLSSITKAHVKWVMTTPTSTAVTAHQFTANMTTGNSTLTGISSSDITALTNLKNTAVGNVYIQGSGMSYLTPYITSIGTNSITISQTAQSTGTFSICANTQPSQWDALMDIYFHTAAQGAPDPYVGNSTVWFPEVDLQIMQMGMDEFFNVNNNGSLAATAGYYSWNYANKYGFKKTFGGGSTGVPATTYAILVDWGSLFNQTGGHTITMFPLPFMATNYPSTTYLWGQNNVTHDLGGIMAFFEQSNPTDDSGNPIKNGSGTTITSPILNSTWYLSAINAGFEINNGTTPNDNQWATTNFWVAVQNEPDGP